MPCPCGEGKSVPQCTDQIQLVTRTAPKYRIQNERDDLCWQIVEARASAPMCVIKNQRFKVGSMDSQLGIGAM